MMNQNSITVASSSREFKEEDVNITICEPANLPEVLND